jgi:hypothetical protein
MLCADSTGAENKILPEFVFNLTEGRPRLASDLPVPMVKAADFLAAAFLVAAFSAAAVTAAALRTPPCRRGAFAAPGRPRRNRRGQFAHFDLAESNAPTLGRILESK